MTRTKTLWDIFRIAKCYGSMFEIIQDNLIFLKTKVALSPFFSASEGRPFALPKAGMPYWVMEVDPPHWFDHEIGGYDQMLDILRLQGKILTRKEKRIYKNQKLTKKNLS
jgi:hypothetical protein